jgi:hypothetical protein
VRDLGVGLAFGSLVTTRGGVWKNVRVKERACVENDAQHRELADNARTCGSEGLCSASI